MIKSLKREGILEIRVDVLLGLGAGLFRGKGICLGGSGFFVLISSVGLSVIIGDGLVSVVFIGKSLGHVFFS